MSSSSSQESFGLDANATTEHKSYEVGGLSQELQNEVVLINTALQSASKLMSSIGLRVTGGDARKQSKFNRSNLPSPKSFWASRGIAVAQKNGWCMAKCAFHEDQHASLGVNCETGGFICHACGVKGGDILAAQQLLLNCDFITAAKSLGAWEEK